MRKRTYWHPKMRLRIIGKDDGRLAFSVIAADADGLWPSTDLGDGTLLLLSSTAGGPPTHALIVASFEPGSYRTVAEKRGRPRRTTHRSTHTGILTSHSFRSI